MIAILNTFILVVLGCAGLLGVSALVEKRTARRRRDAQGSSNIAA